MNRIDETFARLRPTGEKAFIPFITAGDPSLEATVEIALALEKAGASVLELGVPFSDPMADGPTIQASSLRALEAGATLAKVLETVRKIRQRSQIPIILFGYYNPFFQYGIQRLARDAADAGADGFLIVDLPPEESGELDAALGEAGLRQIFLLAPTSDEARIEAVLKKAGGFVYFVSVTGVTGARAAVAQRVREKVDWIRGKTQLPVCVGFGVSTAQQVREIAEYADGAVVGSALVQRIHEADDPVAEAGAFAASLLSKA